MVWHYGHVTRSDGLTTGNSRRQVKKGQTERARQHRGVDRQILRRDSSHGYTTDRSGVSWLGSQSWRASTAPRGAKGKWSGKARPHASFAVLDSIDESVQPWRTPIYTVANILANVNKLYSRLIRHSGEYMANGLMNAIRHQFAMIAKWSPDIRRCS